MSDHDNEQSDGPDRWSRLTARAEAAESRLSEVRALVDRERWGTSGWVPRDSLLAILDRPHPEGSDG